MSSVRIHFACTTALALAGMVREPPQLRAQTANLPTATVHIEVFGPFGERIPTGKARIHLVSHEPKLDLAPTHGVIRSVPYGSYVVSASDAGGSFGERELTVNTAEVWVRLGLLIVFGDSLGPSGFLSITGDIRPAPKSESWWVRVEGVFLHVSKDAPVSRTGRFSIGGLNMGAYLVEVFEGAKLRRVVTTEIDLRQPDTHLSIPMQPGSALIIPTP